MILLSLFHVSMSSRLFMHPHIHAQTRACPRAFMSAFEGRVSQASRGSQEAGQVEKGLRRAVTSPCGGGVSINIWLPEGLWAGVVWGDDSGWTKGG